MSMTKDALQYLHEQSLIRADIKTSHPDLYPGMVLPKECEVKSLEHLQPFRNRFTGTFKTLAIADFAAYINKHEQVQCFIDSKTPVATAIFDLGTPNAPGHAAHKAKLELEQTPDFIALLEFTSRQHSQQSLAEFLEDWKFNLAASDASGEEMEVKKAIAAVRRVTIDAKKTADHAVGQLSNSKSSLEQLDANSGGAPLPAWIKYSCNPYHGLSVYDFFMRVSMSIHNENIVFKLSIANLAKQRQAYLEEFMAEVQAVIDSEASTVYIGSFETK